jgi:hypothetical protein
MQEIITSHNASNRVSVLKHIILLIIRKESGGRLGYEEIIAVIKHL